MREVHTTPNLAISISFLLGLIIWVTPAPSAVAAEVVLPGLIDTVEVTLDTQGVPHIIAQNDFDLARVQGYIHARDRFFQMDLTRRQVSGDMAELLGSGVLGSDIQNRTIGLRRAAVRSAAVLTARERDLLQAYADGVNESLASNPLPIEYGLLELTRARPWDVVDSLVIVKAIAASLSLDIDIGPTLQLQGFIEAGIAGGFDGQAMFFEDVVRSAPMDPASTVPDATNTTPFLSAKVKKVEKTQLAKAAAGAERIKEKFTGVALLEEAMNRRETFIGSNEWGIAADKTEAGHPIIANDPHLSLNIPSTFYEWHLVVRGDPVDGDMDVSGVGFPGAPSVILGQNQKVTWGATTNPMDVSDIFSDTLKVGLPECIIIGALACIESDGVHHAVEIEFPVYRYNVIGDSIPDNLVVASLPPDQSTIATVPFRSFGPILDIDDPSVIVNGGVTTALTLQYTGFHATRELRAFQTWNRAKNLSEFLEGLANFDVGSQNWAYADVDGNLAYFSSAENPLRKDLELGTVVGLPPYFIRDGSGPNNWVPDPAHSQGQAIPFDIIPFSEMPQTVNPANGFFVNANNDPAGTTLDNNPLNQARPSKPTAIYYLNPGYAIGMRAGRITRLVEAAVAAGDVNRKKLQIQQSNTQQLDAELMTPFLLAAFANASDAGAPAELSALAADPGIAEAVGRLAAWDFSTPTGIPEGYDASDKKGVRSNNVKRAEKQAAVAATLYNVWRAKAIKAVVSATLSRVGAPGVGSSDGLKALDNLLVQEPFTGVGVSGVDFFPEPVTLSNAEDRRDATLLAALRTALDALASNDFLAAFGNSTDQDDYLWGKLHRITFDHPFVPEFSIPPAAGFEDLGPGLPGLSRDGGYNVVNASGFSATADGTNEFRFGSGPVRRYVGGPTGIASRRTGRSSAKISGVNVMPGGPSENPFSPNYATQLGLWLTADQHSVPMGMNIPKKDTQSKDTFVPSP
jgi:penicillin amidase